MKARRFTRCSALLVIAALIATGPACDEDPAGPAGDGAEPGIVGTVLGAGGQPLPFVPVGVIYGVYQGQDGWPPEEFGGASPRRDREQITVRFALGEASTVRLLVQDFLYRPRRLLLLGELAAGSHEVHFDWTDDAGLPLPNGLYGTRLEITRPGFFDVLQEGGLLRNTLSLDFGSQVGALVTTDAEGGFRIPYTELPIGEWAYCWDGQDGVCTIPDSLWIQSVSATGLSARRLLRVEDFGADLPVTLHLTQPRD